MNYEDGASIMASIYLTGHPDDLEQQSDIIERLSQEESFNAIRYDDEAEVPLRELKAILSKMDLILVFVSSKYLYTDNAARDFIISYAEEKQIPVIAFSLEKYIEYDFRKQFGNTMFFDPYKEEINSSINEQFVIMMKMLLTVGIQDAFMDISDIPEVLQKLAELNKSGLVFSESFMMAIVWQAKVMAHAQKAYMESGALEDLQKWTYECSALGDFLRELGRDQEALSIYRSLLAYLQSKKPDQKRLQYILLGKIGYAYENLQQIENACQSFSEAMRLVISIIKSECDIKERAIALDDFHKLCKKLGDLYYDANQYSRARELYQSYLSIQNMLVEKSESEGGKQGLADIYERIARIYHITSQLESAKEYYLKCIPKRQSLYDDEPNQPHMQDYASTLRMMGELCIESRDTDSAMKYYQEALKINQQLSEISMSYQTSLNLIILYFKLGDLYFVLENLNEAESYYYKCLVLSTDLSARSGAVEVQKQLLDANIQLLQIANTKGEYENALNYAHNAIKTGNHLLKRRKSSEIQMRIAKAYSLIGNILLQQNIIKEAGNNYRDSLNMFADIAAETGSVDARRNVAIQCGNIGNLHWLNGNFEGAEKSYLEQQRIMEELTVEADSYEIRRELSSCYHNLGLLYLTKQDYEKTDGYYQKRLEICQKLVESAPHAEAKHWLASAYHDCAVLYRNNGQHRKSKNYFDKALNLRRELANTYHIPVFQLNLVFTLMAFADLRERQHQYPDIRAYRTEALQICEKLAIDSPSLSTDDILSDALEAVGSYYAYYEPGLESGVDYIELLIRAVKLRENIANTTQQVEDWDKLAMLYYNISLAVIVPDWQKEFLYDALDTWKYLFERTKDPKYAERYELTKKAISHYHLDDNNDS